jgi:hypothetical protein
VAHTSIYLASAPAVADITGQYFENSTSPKNLGTEILDQTKQEKAWELGTSLVRDTLTANPGKTAPIR